MACYLYPLPYFVTVGFQKHKTLGLQSGELRNSLRDKGMKRQSWKLLGFITKTEIHTNEAINNGLSSDTDEMWQYRQQTFPLNRSEILFSSHEDAYMTSKITLAGCHCFKLLIFLL